MKLSVVIPAYNEEKNIAKCLEYIVNQEEKADEIIVVDNNSTDKTGAIAKKYKARVIKELTQGMIPARNCGFNNAKHDIIARTDADTYVPRNWIKTIKENFRKNKNLVGLAGPASFYDFPIHHKLQHKQWQNKVIFAFIKSRIKHDTLYGPNMAILKNAWEKIKNDICMDDGMVHEDTDLAIHLSKYGDIKVDSQLIVDTSFRRFRKPYTYFEYSHRLFKTFHKHMSKKNVYIHNTRSFAQDIGYIDVLWKEFKPDKEIAKNAAIIYLPGWSLSPSSKPVEKLCQRLAERLNIKAIAVHTQPEKTFDNSLFYEARAIKKLLQESYPNMKQIILITHSQGTVKTIHLANELWEDLNYKIKGIICITPVGLYKLSKHELQIKFLGEITKAIFGSFKEILQKNKSTTDLTLAVLSYVKNEIQKQTFTLYKKRVNQQSHELVNSYPIIMVKLQKIKSKIAFFLAEKDLVSSVKRIKKSLEKAGLRNIHIVEKKNTNHGLPYMQTDILVNEIENLIRKW